MSVCVCMLASLALTSAVFGVSNVCVCDLEWADLVRVRACVRACVRAFMSVRK
jgi:hypothetical protein